MKQRYLYSLIGVMYVCFGIGLHAETVPTLKTPPFSRGVNLNVWFEASSPRQIQFTRYTKKDFENIKSLGADVIRLPINLHFMTDGAPDYRLDPLFLEFLDQAVSWAEELKLYIILDNHTFDPIVPTDPKIEAILVKVWPQMAAHFRSRSSYVLYEILNEPHGIDTMKWAKIQGRVIEAIRSIDQTHTIVVGAANYNNYRDMTTLPVYKDTNLIYTFHFYDPFLFTHQGANWGSPSLVDLAGVPFPAGAGPIPATPSSLRGTWVEGNLRNYKLEGTPEAVKKLLDIPIEFAKKRQVAIFCGEFGVYIPNSGKEDRVEWYRLVREYLEQNNVAWTSWGYLDSFGLATPSEGGVFEFDLNLPLVQALGFAVPPQRKRESGPWKNGFDIYRDYAGEGLRWGGYINNGFADLYGVEAPATGKYAIHWGGSSRYSSVAFDFPGERDLTRLVSEGYILELSARTKSSGMRLEVRFLNPGKTATDIPWRKGRTVDETLIPADGVWHTIRLPLAELIDIGAWKDAWFDPAGKFMWERVSRFEIVAEHHGLEGQEIWFDDIKITR